MIGSVRAFSALPVRNPLLNLLFTTEDSQAYGVCMFVHVHEYICPCPCLLTQKCPASEKNNRTFAD